MVAWGPLVGGGYALLNGLVFTYVGRQLSRRPLAGEERTANQFFVLWWYSLGGLSIVAALLGIAAAWGVTDLALHVVLTYAMLLVICLALWGLGYYLIYLFTGRRGWLLPLGIGYGVAFLYFLYLIITAHPNGVEVGRWGAALTYEQPIATTPWMRAFGLALLAPQVLGALAYMSLLFRVKDPHVRYRIGMVAGSLLFWFGSSIVASYVFIHGVALNKQDFWQPLSRLISLEASIMILLAYQPPGFIARYLSREAAPPPKGVAA